MRIVLGALNTQYVHTSLSIDSIYTYLKHVKKIKDDVLILESSINCNIDEYIADLLSLKGDVYAFSVYLWNVSLFKKVVGVIRSINPLVKIIYGGPEISSNDKDKYFGVDFLITGEGEISFWKLYKNNFKGEKCINNSEKLDLNFMTTPYSRWNSLKNKIIYYEGSRGCPYSCTYCLSGKDNNLTYKNIEKIISDLKKLIEKGSKIIKFIDRTFNANREWSYLLGKRILDEFSDQNITFHFEVSIDKVDERLLRLFERARDNIFQLEIGIQSTNRKTLFSVKRINDFEKIKINVNRLMNANNIHLHLDLICGLPYEGSKSFVNSFNEVFRISGDMLQLGFLKVIPNTIMKEEALKYGIIYRDYPPYEVLETKYITYDEVRYFKIVEMGLGEFFNCKNFKRTFIYFKDLINNPIELFYSLGLEIKKNGKINIEKKFNLLKTELEKFFSKDKVAGVMKVDYYLNKEKFTLPEVVEFKKINLLNLGFERLNLKYQKGFSSKFDIDKNYNLFRTDVEKIYILDYRFKIGKYGYPKVTVFGNDKKQTS